MNFLVCVLLLILNIQRHLCFEAVVKFKDKNLTENNLHEFTLKYNLILKGKLFDEFFIFELNKKSKRSIQSSFNFSQDPLIKWFEIQKELKRTKRDEDYYYYHDDEEEIIHFPHKSERAKYKFLLEEELEDISKKSEIKCQPSKVYFNDPKWNYQWYMNDGCEQGFSLNITQAWKMGFTGKGVVLSVIDDGLEKDNFDLISNYDPKASYDFNDNDTDPQPRYEETNENKHGTRCAGEIAAKANNSFCGVGVAFNAKIGGIRLLDGKITDRLEAQALGFNFNYIDILSASWGPLDDGKTVDGPGILSYQAFQNGIRFGRNGKGSIFVWASGNGGRLQDNCNCDGYTSSIFTITIGSVNQEGLMPIYGEKCSSILASTFSSGNSFQAGVITTDLHNTCTKRHTGTSASAPIGAGIIALALEANSNLTWRDVQYLIIKSSDPIKLKAKDWQKNGIGKFFSHNYGYGLMNAGRMVESALKWPNIGEQIINIINFMGKDEEFVVESKSLRRLSMEFKNATNKKLNYLEHVVASISIEARIRGKIKIRLISPSNTRSTLLEFRGNDLSSKGFRSWPFMSVHFWAERPYGIWVLEILNNNLEEIFLKEWELKLFGVEFVPKIFF